MCYGGLKSLQLLLFVPLRVYIPDLDTLYIFVINVLKRYFMLDDASFMLIHVY